MSARLTMVVLIAAMMTPLAPIGAQAPAASQAAPQVQFEEGRRLFVGGDFDKALPVFDAVIAALTSAGPPQNLDLLAQAYEYRARARFNEGDTAGTEKDLAALLAIRPGFKFTGNVSPQTVSLLETIRKATIGSVTLSLSPPGAVEIDGRPYTLTVQAQSIDLPAGERQIVATRPGYRPIDQKVTVTAGQSVSLALELERVSSTLQIVSIPADVEVLLDDTPRGRTAHATGEMSAPLVLTDLPNGPHRILLRRECHQPAERTITIDKAGDFRTDPIRLTPATATVTIKTAEPGARLFIDGEDKGPLTGDPITVCEGLHVIDVRGAAGRFIDRRTWKTGETVPLTAELRRAFPIVTARGGSVVSADQLKVNVQQALERSARVLIYAPTEAELSAAMTNEAMPADWLVAESPGVLSTRVPRDVTRELGRRLSARLEAQGIAAVSGGSDPYTMTVALLAPGSGEPDLLTINLADQASRTRAIAALDSSLRPLVRASIETTVIDVAGTPGAVVIRSTGVGARAGLTAGDVIVGAGGSPVASVADLSARIAAVRPPASNLALDVRSLAGASRTVTVAITHVPDTLPQRDPTILYNRTLIDLQDALRATGDTPVTIATRRLNLGIVHMRLGNCDDALTAFGQTTLPDGAGVSAGTVAYFSGLCYEQTGRALEAQAAFTKAAAASQARLWHDGPLVAPLARQKLQGRR